MTPEMGEQLNLSLTEIAVRDPEPGEAVVRIVHKVLVMLTVSQDACFSMGHEPEVSPSYGLMCQE